MIQLRNGSINVYECKINPDEFDPKNLKIFRRIYPNGENFLVTPATPTPYEKRIDDLIINVVSTDFYIQSE